MKNIALPRLVKWMFLTGVAFLIFMTLMRYVFFIHFHSSQYTFSNCFEAILLGLHFDTRIVCGIVLFPFVIGNLHIRYNKAHRFTIGSTVQLVFVIVIMVLLLIFMKKGHAPVSSLIYMGILFALVLVWLLITKNCNPYENAISRIIFKIYFFIISISLALLYAIDFEYFDYLHQRLNASILNFAGDAAISIHMVWQTYPVLTLALLVIISTALLFGLINRWFNKIQGSTYRGMGFPGIVIGVLFALVLGVGIFGKLNQYPLRWSDAFSFNDDFKANLALNPVQSFLSTLEFRNSTYDNKKVRNYYSLMADFLGVKNPDSSSLNYKRHFTPQPVAKTPNVVVVICESFSAYKSSMWGNPLNTTPYFDEMCKQGIFFDRCFTPSWGTARGVWAVITGIPDVEYPNTASRNPAAVDQHTLINDYAGYDKYYFIGGNSSWANIRGLLTNNITGLNIYEQGDYKASSIDVWGISDKRLFLASNNVLKDETHPFFAVIQTADNHRPYTIPDEDKAAFQLKKYSDDSLKRFGFQSNEELNAFRYTDFSFETFIEAAKKEKYFNKTIFVFVGDHGIRGQVGDMFPKAWETDGLTTQHVPLLFYAPALLAPQRIDRTCSQVDLVPSATALAHIAFTNTTIGVNLFDTVRVSSARFKNAAFLFDPNLKQIGMVTDEYCYVHNLLSSTEDFRSARNNEPLPETAVIAEDRKALKELAQAYYETARYMMLHNSKKEVLHQK
jgi:phosphoglycerol transferase MdoB-like AlkP superfamily enzyme